MSSNPFVSVIVPTYNRAASLTRLLESLSLQTYPSTNWETIIVNDGSTDSQYQQIDFRQYPIQIQMLWQENAGASVARNYGAIQGNGDILIFLDDDIIVSPDYVSSIVDVHKNKNRVIVAGVFVPYLTGNDPPFRSACARSGVTQISNSTEELTYYEVVSHNFSIKRQDFIELGMFQDPTKGNFSPHWDDIDLAYRAYRAGFCFARSITARGTHADYSLENFKIHCTRVYRAGAGAVYLFEKYPELINELPMFRDKTPINLQKDDPKLVVRKLMRRISANKTILHGMEFLISNFEKHFPDSRILVELYRWVNSTYIYRGYRDNLFQSLLYE